jgi:hypothetical protein
MPYSKAVCVAGNTVCFNADIVIRQIHHRASVRGIKGVAGIARRGANIAVDKISIVTRGTVVRVVLVAKARMYNMRFIIISSGNRMTLGSSAVGIVKFACYGMVIIRDCGSDDGSCCCCCCAALLRVAKKEAVCFSADIMSLDNCQTASAFFFIGNTNRMTVRDNACFGKNIPGHELVVTVAQTAVILFYDGVVMTAGTVAYCHYVNF